MEKAKKGLADVNNAKGSRQESHTTVKITDEKLLGMIRKSMVAKEKLEMKEATQKIKFDYKPVKINPDASFNKEETEAIMEKLMNKIVANPALINGDTELNQRIEKIFNLEAFQKMVDNADIFQDLSSSSMFSNSQILQKSAMLSQNTTFAKINPETDTHKSMTEESKILNQDHDDSLFKEDAEDPKQENSIKHPKKNDLKKSKEHVGKIDHKIDEKVEHKKQIETKTKSQEEKKSTASISTTEEFYQVDEYKDNEDPGFIIKEINEVNFEEKCNEYAEEFNYPAFSFLPSSNSDIERLRKKLSEDNAKKKKAKEAEERRKKQAEEEEADQAEGEEDIPTQLPKWVKFIACDDEFYPAEFNGVVYD